MRIYYLSPNCWVDKTFLTLVAGGRFELPTSGLWIQRSHQLSYPAIPVIPMDCGFENFWKIHLCVFLCVFYPFLWSHISFSSSRYTLRNFSPGIGLIVSYFWFGKSFSGLKSSSGRAFQRGKGEWSSTWSQRNDEVGGTLVAYFTALFHWSCT